MSNPFLNLTVLYLDKKKKQLLKIHVYIKNLHFKNKSLNFLVIPKYLNIFSISRIKNKIKNK